MLEYSSAYYKNEDDIFNSMLTESFICDYGFIKEVSDDGKTVDVEHIVKGVDRSGNVLDATLTKKVEVLYPCSAYLSINWKLKKGDGVLLIGLKDYVKSIADKTKPEEAKYFYHYKQETMKAIPLGFNDSPKTVITVTDEEIDITSDIKNTNINLKTDLTIETDANLKLTCNNNTIETSVTSVTINGNFEVMQ